MKKKILCIILVFFIFASQPIKIYALDSDHGGGGGTHEDGGTSYEGKYSLKDFFQLGIDSGEYAGFGIVEFGKLVTLLGTTIWGSLSGNLDYKSIAESFALWNDNAWTGEWIHVDANNNVTYDQQLVDLLKQFLEAYAQEHPDEVEKISYRIIHTQSYEDAYENYLAYENVLEGAFTVPEGSNSFGYFRSAWETQTKYPSFPRLISLSAYARRFTPETTKDITIGQEFSIYEGYESGRNICLIGEMGGNGWGTLEQYHIAVYTYDAATGALALDRRSSGITQNRRFIWDESSQTWTGSEQQPYFFSNSGYAYINMSGSYWGGGWGYYAQNIDQEYGKRYYATYNEDGSVNIPVLATPEPSAFRLFATEQDALRYYEACGNSGLNFNPDQVYTGGNVVINNNGDVYITNDPPGGGDDPEGGGSSGILGVLEDIRDYVKKIYHQVIIGNVINAIDALADVLDTLKDYLDEAMGDVAAIGELGEEVVTKFPFSLPRDILLVVTLFEADPVAPVWEIPFRADFGGPTGITVDEPFTIDFTDFEDAVDVLKWFLSLVWVFGLAMLTPKVLGTGGIGSSKGD